MHCLSRGGAVSDEPPHVAEALEYTIVAELYACIFCGEDFLNAAECLRHQRECNGEQA